MPQIKDKEGIFQQQEKCSKLPTREIQLGSQLTSQKTCCRPQGEHLAFKMLKGKNNFSRNFNRTSLSWKEQATTTTMKIEGKSYWKKQMNSESNSQPHISVEEGQMINGKSSIFTKCRWGIDKAKGHIQTFKHGAESTMQCC